MMISFGIPAHNEEALIGATIRSIRRSATGAGVAYEVVVAADACTDRTAAIARDLGARVVEVDVRQIAAARNAAGRAMRGDVLVWVDADTEIAPEHVRRVVRAVEGGAVGGGAVIGWDEDVPAWARFAARLFAAVYSRFKLIAGCFAFCTREAYDRVGGWDERYFASEELYFTRSLKQLGRLVIVQKPVRSSARKVRMHHFGGLMRNLWKMAREGPKGATKRENCDLWYDGRREPAR